MVFGPPIDLPTSPPGPRKARNREATDRIMAVLARMVADVGGPVQDPPVGPQRAIDKQRGIWFPPPEAEPRAAETARPATTPASTRATVSMHATDTPTSSRRNRSTAPGRPARRENAASPMPTTAATSRAKRTMFPRPLSSGASASETASASAMVARWTVEAAG